MSETHRVPALDRMVELLEQLERGGDGLTINELVTGCGIPRSTVYRILNTLASHGLVSRTAGDGRYRLGARFLAFAAKVPNAAAWRDLADLARPYMQRLGAESRETIKLSVLDGDDVLCIAVVPGSSRYTVAAAVGTRYPLHAGAAGKIILTALAPAAREALLAAPLAPYTPKSIIDPRLLRQELQRIERHGWSEDAGEFSLSVHALAAPVTDAEGRIIAALSVCYLADRDMADLARLRARLLRAAADMSAQGVAAAPPKRAAG
ncbi:MAG: IclR family transcriptional regulator [Proteobacteria bacterium]|nr:IclR family transcriptional regulator [Pseudomonadota bacterium]MBI3498420.1 IclR family transcriptional regulator [Pseudomonadota bacterium]